MAQVNDENINEPKDFAPYLWWGILVVVLIMVGLILALGKRTPGRSEVRAKHILVKFDQADPADRSRALQLIQEIRDRIEKGESFEKLAEEYSNDPASATRGGDLGRMAKGKFEEQFENYVWSAPLNELSGVVQTSFGYHLIVVTERHVSAGDAYEMELERRVTEVEKTVAPATAPAPAAPAEPAPAAAPAS
jgi:parvulin-like peptidyl-prolyl isomerase